MSLNECYRQVLINWFCKEKSERKFIDEAINIMEQEWSKRNIFIIEAPTGYGKSTISAAISLFSLKSDDSLKCIVAFPLRTLLEDQYRKFIGEKKRGILGDLNREQVTNIIGKRYMHNPDSRYLIKPITLTTVDTLAMTLFGIPPECVDSVIKAWDGTSGGSLGHYLFSWGSVILSNIVLDEVHLLADSTKSLSFLVALMRIAEDFNQKLILMSATVPESLKSVLNRYLPDKIRFIEFDSDKDPCFLEDRASKEYHIIFEEIKSSEKFERIKGWIDENKDFSRVIVVFNTVEEATYFYKYVKDIYKDKFNKIVLIHGRFSEKDREKKVDEIMSLKKRPSSSTIQDECKKEVSPCDTTGDTEKGSSSYLIISTQVIEAGIDISSNLFITDIAPANSLIQRLGRFLRDTTEEDKRGKAIIWYEGEGDKEESEGDKGLYKVYDRKLVRKTIEWLKNNLDDEHRVKINVHLPKVKNSERKGYKELLDYVYEDGCFKVEDDIIRDFEGVFLHLENASLIAVEKFLEMEGSFVRDELQIPVVSKYKIDEIKDENDILSGGSGLKPSDFVRELVVPLSFKSFRRKASDVYGVVATSIETKNGKKHIRLEFREKENDSWLSSILRKISKFEKSPNKEREIIMDVLRYIFRREVLAFVIDAKYDEDFGLGFDEHD
ncbi:MAG: CRISPR-associated helicase Cas3' [Candidatus Methanodesulfokora washburnensis]|jgi:CRISPR-associated endonuclease/helicase Cas3